MILKNETDIPLYLHVEGYDEIMLDPGEEEEFSDINDVVAIRTLPPFWSPERTDYLYCETCDMVIDFWKYGHDLAEAGHEGHQVRELTEEEYRQALKECEEAGCLALEELWSWSLLSSTSAFRLTLWRLWAASRRYLKRVGRTRSTSSRASC